MGFVKVVKNKAYFMRYQVKFRRRRQCKTDYFARKRLIIQDKNKYKSPKYRFVVRISNRDIVCQIFSTDLTHDVCVAAAYSHELARYGIKVGLTNYAAAYCVGLLLARRVNAKYGLNYEGNTEIDGEDFNVEADDEKRPFKALLDVGLARTKTGARVFGAMKGACDGGIDIPHGDRRFPGSKKAEGEWETNAEFHRKYIFGGHVAEYMTSLAGDEEAYKRQFARFTAAGLKADNLEAMYKKAHAAIRKDPLKKRDPKELGKFKTRPKPKNAKYDGKAAKTFAKKPLSHAQRKDRIKQKLLAKGVTPLSKMGVAAVAAAAVAADEE